MICRYCGNTVDAETTVCPYCGTALVGYNTPVGFEEDTQYDEQMYYEEPQQDYAPKKKKSLSVPSLPFSTLISVACAVFSLICLFMVSSTRSMVKESSDLISGSLSQLQSATCGKCPEQRL